MVSKTKKDALEITRLLNMYPHLDRRNPYEKWVDYMLINDLPMTDEAYKKFYNEYFHIKEEND